MKNIPFELQYSASFTTKKIESGYSSALTMPRSIRQIFDNLRKSLFIQVGEL